MAVAQPWDAAPEAKKAPAPARASPLMFEVKFQLQGEILHGGFNGIQMGFVNVDQKYPDKIMTVDPEPPCFTPLAQSDPTLSLFGSSSSGHRERTHPHTL